MGYKISWFGVENLPAAEVAALFGLHMTGTVDEANEAPFSIAELPTGWTVLWANDFDFLTVERLQALATDRRMVGVQLHEGVMVSHALCVHAGREVWSLVHDGQEGPRNLDVEGAALPEAFDAIRARLFAEQDANDAGDKDTDYVFDVPLEVAASVVGFRHDLWKYDWGQPDFRVAQGEGQDKAPWWRRLFKG